MREKKCGESKQSVKVANIVPPVKGAVSNRAERGCRPPPPPPPPKKK